jgi:hypothetical protein
MMEATVLRRSDGESVWRGKIDSQISLGVASTQGRQPFYHVKRSAVERQFW